MGEVAPSSSMWDTVSGSVITNVRSTGTPASVACTVPLARETTGASFTATTSISTVTTSLSNPPSLTWKVKLSEPL